MSLPSVRVRFHPLVWLLWLLAGVLSVGSNPLHNVLIMLGAALVAVACRDDGPVGRALGLFMRLGLLVVAVRLLLSTVAVGGFAFGETPLGRLPVLQLPWWLGGLKLGGPFTVEMVATGMIGGIQLATLLALFGAFNASADHYGLVRRMPNFLGGAGLVITIALAFVPQTLIQLRVIREAQRVRGHHFRTWRDTLPLLVPLISGGLERSFQLAEAMDSRGYGAQTPYARTARWQTPVMTWLVLWSASLGLFMLLYGAGGAAGPALLALAALLLVWAARVAGRASGRTRYLRERWRRQDRLAVAAACLLLVAVQICRRLTPDVFVYNPLPRATLPPFSLPSLALVLLLIVPAAITVAYDRV